MNFVLILCLAVSAFTAAAPAAAAESGRFTPSLAGMPGLNLAPSARMDPEGTVRITAAAADPYAHAVLSAQVAAPLNVALRQTAQAGGPLQKADRLLPGIDLRLRLMREGVYAPELALGLQSAAGHARMAGEYLVMSRRYGAFDFTAGMGWGRFGGGPARAGNPFSVLGPRFGRDRGADGEMPNGPADWFTGGGAGFFGGVEYETPIDGLSVKADWGADAGDAESAAVPGFKPPAPWSAGVSYRPLPWASLGAAVAGGQKFMATLSLQSPLKKWFGASYKNRDAAALAPRSAADPAPQAAGEAAAKEGIVLRDPAVRTYTAAAVMEDNPYMPLPRQVGRAARHIANAAGDKAAEIRIEPVYYGLRGASVKLMRRDIEQALLQKQGSPEEIWRRASFNEPPPETGENPGLWQRITQSLRPRGGPSFRAVLDAQTSLSEEDGGVLYRTGLVLESRQSLTRHFMAGSDLRLNLFHNLENLHTLRPRTVMTSRGDADLFASSPAGMERSFLGFTATLKPDLHVALASGYLEEMYAGTGGEILYRPFGRTFAVGAEAWHVYKRDPSTALNMGLRGDGAFTGHVNAWYEFPGTDLTLQARAGRYLGGDAGGGLSLTRRFENGASAAAFVTATDGADPDPFGGVTHVYGGLQLRLPLGSVPRIPEGSEIRFRAAQIGRDSGQALDPPLPLYEMTESMSYRHIGEYWTTLLQ